MVTQNGRDLSTPLDTFADATAWVRKYSEGKKIGCYRLSQDVTEVLISDSSFELLNVETGEIVNTSQFNTVHVVTKRYKFLGVS